MGNRKPKEPSFLFKTIRARTSPTGVIHRFMPKEPEIIDSGIPKRPYQETRRDREDIHRSLAWMRDVPLDVVDKELKKVVMEMADGDEMVGVRQLNNSMGKRVKGLGYQGGLELIARVGAVLNDLERGKGDE